MVEEGRAVTNYEIESADNDNEKPALAKVRYQWKSSSDGRMLIRQAYITFEKFLTIGSR